MTSTRFRRLVQLLALSACLLATLGAVPWSLDMLRWLPRLSPLLGITTQVASRAYLPLLAPAVILLALGLILPRLFCGWLCPVGTIIDAASQIMGHTKRLKASRVSLIRYGLLAAILTLAALGTNVAGLLDPLSTFQRGATALALPTWRDLLGGAEQPWAVPDWGPAGLAGHVVAGAVLLLMIGLTILGPRAWCRWVCPLGALYGLLGRFAAFRRSVSDSCVRCGKCGRQCKMQALATDGTHDAPSQCICCTNCRQVCPQNAVYCGPAPRSNQSPRSAEAMLLTRRNFLRTSLIGGLGAAASLLALCLPWAKELRADDAQDPVPRAPGALPEGEFENRCIRCGACVRVCPSKTLEFGTLEKDPRRLWAPRRNLDRPCYFPDCRRCAEVCPVGAIRPLKPIESSPNPLPRVDVAQQSQAAHETWADPPNLNRR